MKILFFVPAMTRFRGGIESMVSSVVNYLAPKGHQILILTTGEETKDPVPLFELHRDVKIVQLWISDTKEVRRKLRSIVMDFNPDVLLARAASSVFFFLLEAVQDLTTAVILSESYPPRASAKHFGSDAARLSAFSAADRIHLFMDCYRDSFPEYLQSRIRVIPNPIVINEIIADVAGVTSQRKSLINVGRITFYAKAQDVLIKAFAKVADDFPDWDLVLVGDVYHQKDHQLLLKLVKKYRLDDRIFFRGSVPHQEVMRILAQSHLFVCSSRFEGFGTANVEAMGTGLPIVGFKGAGAVEQIIQHGQTGYLAEKPGDPQSLAAGMASLMQSTKLRKEYGKNARDFAQQYEKSKILPLWEELILESATLKTGRMSRKPEDQIVQQGALWFRFQQEKLLFDEVKIKTARKPEKYADSFEFRIGKQVVGVVDRLMPPGSLRRRFADRCYRFAMGRKKG